MSCFNSEVTLPNSIESILNQNYTNLELLIVDDCSTDKTFKILKQYQDLDKRVKIFKNQKNIGLTKSLNILIKHSTGEYLARQDSDDVSFDRRLSEQINFLVIVNTKFAQHVQKLWTVQIKFWLFILFSSKFITKFKPIYSHLIN